MAAGKKNRTLICILALVLTVLIGGNVAVLNLFVFHEGYPIYHKSEYVDMRAQIFAAEEYESLKEKLPNCDIEWMVPIGNSLCDSFLTKTVLDELELEYIPMFTYLERLKYIDASKLRCYDYLLELQDTLPDVDVEWYVHVGNLAVDPETEMLNLDGSGVQPQEIMDVLPYLPRLRALVITDVQLDGAFQDQLTSAYPNISFTWKVEASGLSWANTETRLSYAGQSVDVDDLIEASHRLPLVEYIDMSGCGCTAEELLRIKSAFNADVYSDLSLFGISFDTHVTELDFSNIIMNDTSAVEQILPLMPLLKRVEMCNCGISSEEMDALWKRNPEVRFVWSVKIGKATIRTDETSFVGAKHGYLPSFHTANHFEDPYNRLFDKDCEAFKYCVDMVCLDLGHMGISDYSFLQYMPNLKYLLLVDTIGTDFSFLQYNTELVYLEIFLTDFSQTEYLLELKNLKDLNIAYTSVSDITYLKQMNWLERLWISYSRISFEDCIALNDALPNTVVDYTAPTATEHGWRSGYLYYEMRDYLGMYYLPDKVYD